MFIYFIYYFCFLGTPSDGVPAPLVPVCGNIIKMLKMPTISWSTRKNEEHEEFGEGNTDAHVLDLLTL